MAANPRCVVTCLDCGHRSHVPRAALGRRTRIRCSMCGGAVEASPAARAALISGMDTRQEWVEEGRQRP